MSLESPANFRDKGTLPRVGNRVHAFEGEAPRLNCSSPSWLVSDGMNEHIRMSPFIPAQYQASGDSGGVKPMESTPL